MTTINQANAVYYRVGQLGGGAASKVYAGSVQVWPPPATYSSVILGTPGLVGYWRLGEPTGTVAADSTGNNPGAYYLVTQGQPGAIAGDGAFYTSPANGFVYVTGPFREALEDALGEAARPTPSADTDPLAMRVLDLGDGPFTLEAWVDPAGPTTAYRNILSKGVGAYTLWFNPDGRAAMHASAVGEVVRSTNPVPSTGWHHIVATKNGAAAKMYVDGVDVTVAVANHTMTNQAQRLHIGAENAGGGVASSHFGGGIDEVALYNQVLTPAQVLAHYNARGA